MNIFPIKHYVIELSEESSKALSELGKNTMVTDSLSSEWTKKSIYWTRKWKIRIKKSICLNYDNKAFY